MNISYNWLKTYFDKEIPEPEKLAEIFNTHMFEVESVSPYKDDFILDVKVLPDRAHHDLCHRGIAREFFAITGINISDRKSKEISESNNVQNIEVENKSDLCRRYLARRIENIKVVDSPKWLKERLESIGARSINNIVDATNFVMFDLGQPLHAFDADKIVGGIKIRNAIEGEKMILLDGREVTLFSTDLLVADDFGPLVIAGVKGGKRAEVTKDTKNIIIESANFDPISVRRTSTRLDLRNDSSKRFENEISPELALETMNSVCNLILDLNSEAIFGKIKDDYKKVPEVRNIIFNTDFICSILGKDIDEKEIISILERIGIKITKDGDSIVAIIPNFRLDLNIPEDIADEVGRIYGYDKFESKLPPDISGNEKIDKFFFYTEKVKNILVKNGFSETILYSLVSKGYFEIAKPLASDKAFLRENLKGKVKEALILNSHNAPLLDLETVKIFEIGNVFHQTGEKISLCLGVSQIKKKKNVTSQSILDGEIKKLQEKIGVDFQYKIETGDFGAVCEIDFSEISSKMSDEMILGSLEFTALPQDIKYKSFSVFPFSVRDVAFFSVDKIDENKIADEIKEKAGQYLVHLSLFDVFSKDFDGVNKTSYAYHLVFQAPDKTLVEDEIASAMNNVYNHLKSLNFEVR